MTRRAATAAASRAAGTPRPPRRPASPPSRSYSRPATNEEPPNATIIGSIPTPASSAGSRAPSPWTAEVHERGEERHLHEQDGEQRGAELLVARHVAGNQRPRSRSGARRGRHEREQHADTDEHPITRGSPQPRVSTSSSASSSATTAALRSRCRPSRSGARPPRRASPTARQHDRHRERGHRHVEREDVAPARATRSARRRAAARGVAEPDDAEDQPAGQALARRGQQRVRSCRGRGPH